jgi:hypothetical protein
MWVPILTTVLFVAIVYAVALWLLFKDLRGEQ